MSDLKLDHQRRDLHKSNLAVTSRKIRPVSNHKCSDKSFVYPRIKNNKRALKTKSKDLNAPIIKCTFVQSPLCVISSPRVMSAS
jgi:hypothetical protein